MLVDSAHSESFDVNQQGNKCTKCIIVNIINKRLLKYALMSLKRNRQDKIFDDRQYKSLIIIFIMFTAPLHQFNAFITL